MADNSREAPAVVSFEPEVSFEELGFLSCVQDAENAWIWGEAQEWEERGDEEETGVVGEGEASFEVFFCVCLNSVGCSMLVF